MKKMIFLTTLYCFISFLLTGSETQKVDSLTNFYRCETTEPVPEKMKQGFDSIQSANLENYLEFLASDLMEGRDTTSETYRIAAEYAASLLRLWNLKPAGDLAFNKYYKMFDKIKYQRRGRTYLQEVIMKKNLDYDQSITLHYRQGDLNHSRTFYPDLDYMRCYFFIQDGKTVEINSPLVFVGYGISEKSINFDEYKGIDVRGKVVLMFTGVPQADKDDSPFKKGALKEKYFPPPEKTDHPDWLWPPLELAMKKGAAAVLLVRTQNQDRPSFKRLFQRKDINSRLQDKKHTNELISLFPGDSLYQVEETPTITIPGLASYIFETSNGRLDLEKLQNQINQTLTPQSRELPGLSITIKHNAKTQLQSCWNVLGFIEGSDPVLKKEIVMIGAHLDHMGKIKNEIINGAADNASGSAGVIELAKAFTLNPVKPKRTLLFALWTGEERNLQGSRFYANIPFFPLKNTTAYVNLDMIGWQWENIEQLSQYQELTGAKSIPEEILKKIDLENFLLLPLTGNSRNLYETLKNNDRHIGMSLYPISIDDGYPGDCVPFARQGIPCLQIYTGNTDKYHTPKDDIEYIDFQLMEKVTRLVYLTVFQLADQ